MTFKSTPHQGCAPHPRMQEIQDLLDRDKEIDRRILEIKMRAAMRGIRMREVLRAVDEVLGKHDTRGMN